MDEFNLEKLAREIVIGLLKDADDAPTGAGELARQIVTDAVVGTRARQTPRDSVRAACRGLMTGMLFIKKDLPLTAVAILRQTNAIASDTHQDPSELLSWAMEGIAPVVLLAGGRAPAAVEQAVESAFAGAGRIFSRACETAGGSA
ncbi:MAG: hypothetical protein HY403_03705 [Elusimicrobia bacterium]|nr:hypothetical protein [Elusimicrobiota bacterium]